MAFFIENPLFVQDFRRKVTLIFDSVPVPHCLDWILQQSGGIESDCTRNPLILFMMMFSFIYETNPGSSSLLTAASSSPLIFCDGQAETILITISTLLNSLLTVVAVITILFKFGSLSEAPVSFRTTRLSL